ncbi:PspC domain-containing protein [Actinoplanes sp. RD1]|uniref:PspC domain-containing protein n=1 Tax=Actinoplanes sp. RD1 TaxID=3064538 RepID=UPI002741F36F|nr:PspC domain-containing protein [Actinoplanes sp. RD1]
MTDEAAPPPPGGTTPPPPPPGNPPPWFGAGTDGPVWSREKLIRPAQGRYIAGVSGAIGRATNTDPVLWRVLLAVLGFFGGVGVLVYLLGWLLIPAEGDTASPLESLLGRGKSAMKPLSVVLLGAGAALTFAFIVQDGFRATLLAAAVLVCAALVLKRSGKFPAPPAAAPTVAFSAPTAEPAATAPAGEPVTPPPPDPYTPPPGPYTPPQDTSNAPQDPYTPPQAPRFTPPQAPRFTPPQAPRFTPPPPGGYRPPFAPHGPFAQGADRPPYGPPPQQAPAPRAPKPPKQRSKLGRITFFGLIVVMGVLALADSAGASVPVSAYFAAALTTIATGLIVGAWLGRARGLIFLALLATFGLAVSTGVERFGGHVANSNYRPQTLAAVADRYDFTIGNATLDLRALDFTGQDQAVAVSMRVGQVRVLLPDSVDTSVTVALDDGRAAIFGQSYDGGNLSSREITDLGVDGRGGGTLRLTIDMDAGNVEVIR